MNFNKKIIALSLLGVLLGGLLYFENNKNIENSTSSTSYFSQDLKLSKTDVKMKNNGEYFILQALVNENATIKSITFTSIDPTSVEVVKIDESSCKVIKLKDFLDTVTITVKPDDPFSKIVKECKVRCYNTFKSFNTFYANKIYDDEQVYKSFLSYHNEDEIYLRTGLTYECKFILETIFSYLNEDIYDVNDTFINIEEDDMNLFENEFQKILGNNPITSFTQNLSETSANTIVFTFTYLYPIDFEGNVNKKETIEFDGNSYNINLKNYNEVEDIELNNNNLTIVI